MKKLQSILGLGGVAILAIALLVGCSTDSGTNSVVGPDEIVTPNSEPDIAGIDLLKNGKLALTVFNGVVQDGAIEIPTGQNSDVYRVVFVDENDEEFMPKGDQYSLEIKNQNISVCNIIKHPNLGEYYFCITGKKAGQAEFELSLMDEQSTRYTSPMVPVTVR